MNTVTQKMLFRQSLIKYAEKYGVTKAAIKYNVNRQYIYRWKKRYDGTLQSLGLNWIKLGLQDVLYDPKTKMIYTPNMNQSMQMSENPVSFGEKTVDNGGKGGIIEERKPVFDDNNGHKIVDNVSDGDSQGNGNDSGKEDKDALISKIKEIGIAGDSYNIPPKVCDVEKLTVDTEHIKSRKHDVDMSEAKSFVSEADISITRWNGKFENYYSSNGASYVNTESKIIRTAFKSSEYDDKTKKMMGEIKKWKKRE